jgi:hypothetical protein
VKNPSGLETGVLKGRVDNQLLEFENREARIPLKLDGKRHIVNLELVPGDRPGLKRD